MKSMGSCDVGDVCPNAYSCQNGQCCRKCARILLSKTNACDGKQRDFKHFSANFVLATIEFVRSAFLLVISFVATPVPSACTGNTASIGTCSVTSCPDGYECTPEQQCCEKSTSTTTTSVCTDCCPGDPWHPPQQFTGWCNIDDNGRGHCTTGSVCNYASKACCTIPAGDLFCLSFT